jgi:hypothetical protein
MLSEPPRDSADLVNLPRSHVEKGWRVFRAGHSPVFYFRGPSRFVPVLPGHLGVLYLADSPETALGEAFRGRKFIVREDLESRALACISLGHLRLADATGRAGMTFGLTREVAVSPDEGPSQRWAAALAEATFDGIVYPARHGVAGKLIAVFGRAGSTEPPEHVAEVVPISEQELEALGTRVLAVPGDDDLDIVDLE